MSITPLYAALLALVGKSIWTGIPQKCIPYNFRFSASEQKTMLIKFMLSDAGDELQITVVFVPHSLSKGSSND